MKVEDLELVQTCFACPEQYDVRLNGENVGYIRYRHGWLGVNPYENGQYQFNTDILSMRIGDNLDGILDDSSRDKILHECLIAIVNYFNNK